MEPQKPAVKETGEVESKVPMSMVYGFGGQGVSRTQSMMRLTTKQLFQLRKRHSFLAAVVNARVRQVKKVELAVCQIDAKKPFNEETKARMERFIETGFGEGGEKEFRGRMADTLSWNGDSFAEVVFDAAAPHEPVKSQYIYAETMRILPDEHGTILGYPQIVDGNLVTAFEPQNVLHLKEGEDEYSFFGYSPIESLIGVLLLDTLAEEHSISRLENDATPQGIIMQENTSEENMSRLRALFVTQLRQNPGKPVFLNGIVQWLPMGLDMKDMDYQELHRYTKERLMSCYGVLPMQVSVVETGKLANPEQQLEIGEEYIRQILEQIQSGYNRKFTQKFQNSDNLMFKFAELDPKLDVEKQKAEILNLKMNAARTAASIPNSFTVNEIRAMADHDEVEDGDERISMPAPQFPAQNGQMPNDWQQSPPDKDAAQNPPPEKKSKETKPMGPFIVGQKGVFLYDTENGTLGTKVADFSDDYFGSPHLYDELRHLKEIDICCTSIQEKQIAQSGQQSHDKSGALNESREADLSNGQQRSNSSSNIISVCRAGAQILGCKTCIEILRECNDDAVFLDDILNDKQKHKYQSRISSLFEFHMDGQKNPFDKTNNEVAHARLLQIARDYRVSAYKYIMQLNLNNLPSEQKPFANYANFAECVAANQDKENPQAYCAAIMRETENTEPEKAYEAKGLKLHRESRARMRAKFEDDLTRIQARFTRDVVKLAKEHIKEDKSMREKSGISFNIALAPLIKILKDKLDESVKRNALDIFAGSKQALGFSLNQRDERAVLLSLTKTFEGVKSFSELQQAGLKEVVQRSFEEGLSIRDMVKEMRNFSDAETWKLERIARTETNKIANQGRFAGYEELEERRGEEYEYNWIGPDDDRTTEICTDIKKDNPYSLDEIQRVTDGGEPHINCRHDVVRSMK